MAETVALVDYGAGNLHSVDNALRKVGATKDLTLADALDELAPGTDWHAELDPLRLAGPH